MGVAKRWWRGVQYVAVRAALTVLGRLPSTLAYGSAGLCGQAWFLLNGRRRSIALRMLRNAFPGRDDRERLRYGRLGAGNMVKIPLDMARSTRLISSGSDLRRYIDVSQLEAMIPDPPFLAVTPHLGSWEVGAVAMAMVVHEVHGIARVLKNPRMQRFLVENRQRIGVYFHPRRGGLRPLARALARGAVGLQATDQNQRLRGVFVPFFGELASTERAVVTLALRKGYPIVVGRCERIGIGYRFRVIVDEPFVPRDTGDRQRDVERTATEINRRLERHILSCPGQYLWVHDRYRTRPPQQDPVLT